MRGRKRAGLLLVVIVLAGWIMSPAAQSEVKAKDYPVPGYDTINLFGEEPNYHAFAPDRPFFIRHGWIAQPGFKAEDHNFTLFVDGDQREHDVINCDPFVPPQGATCRSFLFDFPDGLPVGEHEFVAMWSAPCEVWVAEGWYQSCVDPKTEMTHPDFVKRHNIVFGIDAYLSGFYEAADQNDGGTFHMALIGGDLFWANGSEHALCGPDTPWSWTGNTDPDSPDPNVTSAYTVVDGIYYFTGVGALHCDPDGLNTFIDYVEWTFVHDPGDNPPHTFTLTRESDGKVLDWLSPPYG